MRGLSVIAGCCLFWTQLALAAEQDFPYTAYISQDGTAIRCAAGRNYYATDQLKRGEMVEVHEHSKDGWCAIRPPEGSFSWVLADSLRVDSDGIGIVLHDKTPCRVGSSVTDLWDVIQVRLSRAEEVEVLDAVLRELKKDDKIENSMWCKIAPPSGEFRWVEAASLSRETPATVLASNSDDQLEKRNDNTSTKPAERNADPAPATVVDTAVSRADRWELDSLADKEVRLASNPAKPSGWKPSTRPLPPDDYPSSRDASADRDRIATRAPLSTTLSPADLGSASGDPAFQAEIDALDFELSTIVTEDSRRWDFRTLSVRCEEAIKQAQNPADRGKIRLIQARMQKFAELRDQEMRLATSTGRAATGTARPTVGSTSSGSTTAISDPFAAITRRSSTAAVAPPANPTSTGLSSLIGTDPLSTESSKFDGIGKLMRVKSQRPNAPKYALVNEENDVVSFVSPAPGVNLQAYEGRYVTVTGQRGFLPELKKGHITAQRVSPALLSQRDGLRRR